MAQKKTSSNPSVKTRLIRLACDAHNGYHNGKQGKDEAIYEYMTSPTGKNEGCLTTEQKLIVLELNSSIARSASFEENCERVYRQMNATIRRLRRVRDAFGRTIGKCR